MGAAVTDLDVLKQIPITDVLDEAGFDYVPRPGGFKMSVRDERTPSCHIYTDNNSFFDYGSGRGGSVIDFVMYVMGCNLERAIMFLESFDIPEVGRFVKSTPKEIQDFSDRFDKETVFISMSMIEAMRKKWPALPQEDDHFFHKLPLGEAAGYTLWVPHFQPDGTCPGIKYRTPQWDKKAVTGSVFTAGFYWPYWPPTIPSANIEHLTICEGESDAWVLRWAGGGMVAALPSGAGCWRDEWLDGFTSLSSITAWIDPDPAGDKAMDAIEQAAFKRDLSLHVNRLRVAESFA